MKIVGTFSQEFDVKKVDVTIEVAGWRVEINKAEHSFFDKPSIRLFYTVDTRFRATVSYDGTGYVFDNLDSNEDRFWCGRYYEKHRGKDDKWCWTRSRLLNATTLRGLLVNLSEKFQSIPPELVDGIIRQVSRYWPDLPGVETST